jgi:alpha-mannosidase
VVAQWEFKRRFAVAADRRSRELLAGAAPPPGSAVEVVNTASWSRSGLVLLPAALSRSGDAARVVEGDPIPSQRLSDGTLAVWLDRVQALGSAVVAVGEGTPAAPARPVVADRLAGDSGGAGIAFDAASGSISGLYSSAAPGRNLAAAGGLMRYLYVRGLDPAAATSNAAATITLLDAGPLVATWRIESNAPGGRHLTRTVRLVAGSSEVGIDVELDKLAVREKESAHLAFPFALPGGVVRVDEGEALLEPGRNQLPGACVDFACAHGAADISRAEVGVSLATLDAPLLELGALTDERLGEAGARAWRTEPAPGTALYVYLLNNYWHTNYKADQEGRLAYRFVLRPHGAFDPVALHRFGEEHERPLLVFPVDPEAPPLSAPFDLGSDTTAVVSALRPVDGGRALLLRLYNPSPAPTEATILVSYGRSRLFVSSEGGETGPALPAPMAMIILPAWGVRVLKLAPTP